MRRLDGQALFAALDAQRAAQGLSWQALGRALGVAASTLKRTGDDGPMETDGVLAMARWLECPLEKFIPGAEAMAREHPQVARFRFSCRALYAALDRERQARGLTWSEAGRAIGGIPAGMLTRLKMGGRIGTHVMVPAVGWLGRTVESFARDPDETGRRT